MDTKPMDIIDRLQDPYRRFDDDLVDVLFDDAIAEIRKLRGEVKTLHKMLKFIKRIFLIYDWSTPEESEAWKEL